ncbi:MAG: tRNA 4-thiouridine(8) synthase ThiI [Acidobacteria bacterium]|nr:MAG: tRNA 4-thiouridine(8) synthase ThiI [Acidobacteriota bacterium]
MPGACRAVGKFVILAVPERRAWTGEGARAPLRGWRRGIMDRVLILHYHEIWLKGKNKRYFLSRLTGAVKRVLADLPAAPPRFVSERLVIEPQEESALPAILERLSRVFGIAYVAVARRTANQLDAMGAAACEVMAAKNPRDFAVRVKIADQDFPMNSMELERALGRMVLDHLRERRSEVRVNLSAPEATCSVEVVPGEAFIYAERRQGPGGLPAATGGRLVALVSGGFDSSVAAYKLMRRGAHLSFAHFYSGPSADGRASSRHVAEELVKALTAYQFTSRLYALAFEPVQRRVVAAAPESLRVLLYRRLMARTAREIARAERALGLVTGDSVSQVASQTLHNLAAMDHGLDFPIYRPLAGDDKEEILAWARRIGTYAISCQPFEDCCPRFMPRAPAIFSSAEELDRAEALLDPEALVTLALESAAVEDFVFESGRVDTSAALPPRFQKLVAWRKTPERPAPPSAPVPARP